MNQLESWGRYPKTTQNARAVRWSCDSFPSAGEGEALLPYGLGRSYGDSCLNDGGTLLVTRSMNRLLDFDPQTGIVRCEAGTSLDAILQFAVPRGWFLPTTPGTKFVTVGGAVANDVHGKNHHRVGTFGCHVKRFELLRSDGQRLVCSAGENGPLFAATIGGLGLTGLMTWVEFALRPIASAMMEVESVKIRNLDDYFEVSVESDKDFEYTVAWVDCLAQGPALGRGILMRGSHAREGELRVHGQPRLAVPVDFPAMALNQFSVRAFNTLYYGRLRQRLTREVKHYDPFFYPLDAIHHWNRIYGRRGFFQYQFTVPFSPEAGAIREVFARIAKSGQGSFLAVLKTFGSIRSPGMLSYPSPGITLALDFANQGDKTFELFEQLNTVVMQAGGRYYPAKDAWMPPEAFMKSYPNWEQFRAFIDPAFSSSFWRRVTRTEARP
jgi:FAD/FMN-containing dehydrogenase